MSGGDKVFLPTVVGIESGPAITDDGRWTAGFTIHTTTGDQNFSLLPEHLGILLTHALKLAGLHAREKLQASIPGGTYFTESVAPEGISVSHSDVAGRSHPCLVVKFGEIGVVLDIGEENLQELLGKLKGPMGPPANVRPFKVPKGTREVTLPVDKKPVPPVSITSLPVNWANYVGHLAVIWGTFESNFDDLLDALIRANKTITTKSNNFRGRRKLFMKEVRKAFDSSPTIRDYCIRLAEDAAAIYVPRNLLAHGRMHGGTENGLYVLTVEGEHARQPIVAKFGEAELVTIYWRAAGLLGRLNYLFDPDDSPNMPQPFSLQEKSLLRSLLT